MRYTQKQEEINTKQLAETDLDMTQVLELSGWEFKITIINMQRSLIEKFDNKQQ